MPSPKIQFKKKSHGPTSATENVNLSFLFSSYPAILEYYMISKLVSKMKSENGI